MGKVVVDTKRKGVQHSTGGRLKKFMSGKEILFQAGQVLIKFGGCKGPK